MDANLPEPITTEELLVTVRVVRINGKQMTLAVFRQLPVIELCTESGKALSPIRPWGIVRQESREAAVWLLLEFKGVLFKAPIHTERLHQSAIEAGISLAKRSLESQHPIRSIDEPRLKRYEWLKQYEDIRVAIHREAMKYPQLYVGA